MRQYWQASRSQAPLRIESAIDQVAEIEVTLTDTVSEALLLEANVESCPNPETEKSLEKQL